MPQSTAKSYLEEIRRLASGGKVTVYRHRDWIVAALREGNRKRAIYDLLVAKEGLTISYQQFAKLTAKLLAQGEPGSAHPEPRKAARSMPDKTPQSPASASPGFTHNPIPNEDELF